MIDENFVRAAIGIKKKYFELTSRLEDYENYVKKTQELIDDALEKVSVMDEDLKDVKKRKSMTNEQVLSDLNKLLLKIENDSKRLENYIKPMNDGIERLAVEEAELYRLIKEKHPNLADQQIVKYISERLSKEGLL